MSEGFKKKVLSPYFASIFVVAGLLIYFIVCFIFQTKFGYFDIEEIGVTEVLTYLFYGFGGGVVFCFAYDYLHTKRQSTYFALVFLWAAALLREMGIQHWLASRDTVITKIRFFTNPNNPLIEKIIAATLMLLVAGVALWLVIKNFKKLVSGFLKLNTICYTIFTFGILAFMTQIADRLPANYLKQTGIELSAPLLFVLKIFEEGGESLLPLLFALAFLQYHLILLQEKQN